MSDSQKYDVIVVGGGHAGAEAAHASARIGCRTLLLTLSRDTIAKASCNPAIGGQAKGQIVCEIDALGGLMGLATDACGIQFRMLNRSKGPAVWSPRAQIDKYHYQHFIRHCLEQTDNLTIAEGMAAEICVADSSVSGVICTDGSRYEAPVMIVTTGTFLRGVMHMGTEQWQGGRLDEPASNELSDSLKQLGFTVGRLKTGTPVRLAGDSIDYSKTEVQPGDDEPMCFSFMNDAITAEQVPCWITYTNERIHQLLRDNLNRAPLYTGQIESIGPRYCPSIETKIMRFADKTRHQVFLEPEDRSVTTIYANGISTSVPKDVQEAMLRLMPGTEHAAIVHYAYAIEYDYCPAVQLKPNLETKQINGLFFAGQINGTSGYEEAGAQGIMAGINAALKLQKKDPLILGRDQAYTGVLVDDLLTKELVEPYRMFTSRAEYRLSLRSDNADRRLTPLGRQVGLVDEQRWNRYQDKMKAIEKLTTYLKNNRMHGKSLYHLLKQPSQDKIDELIQQPAIREMNLPPDAIEAVLIDSKYEGYLARQAKQVQSFRNLENIKLPSDLDYDQIDHLRAEAKERLGVFRPYTLGQASRIGGITPADITVIQIHLKKR